MQRAGEQLSVRPNFGLQRFPRIERIARTRAKVGHVLGRVKARVARSTERKTVFRKNIASAYQKHVAQRITTLVATGAFALGFLPSAGLINFNKAPEANAEAVLTSASDTVEAVTPSFDHVGFAERALASCEAGNESALAIQAGWKKYDPEIVNTVPTVDCTPQEQKLMQAKMTIPYLANQAVTQYAKTRTRVMNSALEYGQSLFERAPDTQQYVVQERDNFYRIAAKLDIPDDVANAYVANNPGVGVIKPGEIFVLPADVSQMTAENIDWQKGTVNV